MIARPEELGPNWGRIRIESVSDLNEERDRWVVRVGVAAPEELDARRALDEALRRRMEPVQGTRRPGDELDVQAASGPDAVERERRGE